jgi:hypothetical protein
VSATKYARLVCVCDERHDRYSADAMAKHLMGLSTPETL